MAGLERRPFIGSWRANSQTVVQHTPDCVVTINGYMEMPGCPSCNGRIDLQRYITQVTVDPTLQPPSSATVAMFIPSVDSQFFFRDGDFLLKSGLEVRIYMRGYFADKFLSKEDAVESGLSDFDPSNTSIFPYYHVFHGVVTEATHEYSNGDYTASLACSDTLHFWENLKISTNGAVLGIRPDTSLVDITKSSHAFEGASPYSIIYTLFRVGFGAAGGVEFDKLITTNVAAPNESLGMSQFKAAALWWETKWSSHSLNLKMFGADGTIYNAFEQAYLGAFEGKNPDVAQKVASTPNNFDRSAFDVSSSPKVRKLIRDLGYNPLSTRVGLATSIDGKQQTTIDVAKIQAFAFDVVSQGNVSIMETEYSTKLEIAGVVTEITGFEFFQDVDGDLVFKPPFYNLNTSTDPVYVIEDRDLISVSEAAREPDATMVKMKGTVSRANVIYGLEAYFLPTAIFIDYRLVAEFGWREAGPFECNYLTDTRSLYISAINRLEVLNASMKSATITIPLRPELRLGYPIYIRYLDCFYYISGLSHQFGYGSQCTTTITGIAKRAKFNAPGNPPGTREARVEDIRLGDLTLPPIQLSIPPEKFNPVVGNVGAEGPTLQDQAGSASGPPRNVGFPNVVMAFDPQDADTGSVIELTAETPDSIISAALDLGILLVDPRSTADKTPAEARKVGPYLLQASNDSEGVQITRAQLISNFDSSQGTVNPTSALGRIIRQIQGTSKASSRNVKNYLNLIKNSRHTYAPGTGLLGGYRYYSCSHPDPSQQGITNLAVENQDGSKVEVPGGPLAETNRVNGFRSDGSYGPVLVESGIPIQVEVVREDGTSGFGTYGVSTSDIYAVTFMKNFSVRSVNTSQEVQNYVRGIGNRISAISQDILAYMVNAAETTDPEETIQERFGVAYDTLKRIIDAYFEAVSAIITIEARQISDFASITSEYGIDTNLTVQGYYTNEGVSEDTYTDEVYAPKLSSALGQEGIVSIFENFSTAAQKDLLDRFAANPEDTEARDDTQQFLRFLVSTNAAITESTDAEVQAEIDATLQEGSAFLYQAQSKPDFTPVYPVSDAQGYEVYGVFPYGRGLTVETYLALEQSPRTLDSEAFLGSSATSAPVLGAVEKLLAAYRGTSTDLTTAFGNLSKEDQRLVALVLDAEGQYDQGNFNIEATLSKLKQTPQSQFKVLASNVPVELAEITVGEDNVCSCKTADAATYLLAATLDPKTYAPTAQAWLRNKEAIAGVSNTAQSLSARFTPFQNDSSRFFANPAIAAAQNAAAQAQAVAALAETLRRNEEG